MSLRRRGILPPVGVSSIGSAGHSGIANMNTLLTSRDGSGVFVNAAYRRPCFGRQTTTRIRWHRLIACGLLLSAAVRPQQSMADDDAGVVVRVPGAVIDGFCEAVFPLKLTGRKRVSVTMLGREVAQEIPWTATVTAPRVTITRAKQTFVAKVVATSSAVPAVTWADEVTGDLSVSYDGMRESIVIRVENVISPVAIGPLRMDLDLSSDIPEMVLLFRVPDIRVPNQRKTVAVQIEPTISFEDDTVIVSGHPKFQTVKGSSTQQDAAR
jgi:hypothetical protein